MKIAFIVRIFSEDSSGLLHSLLVGQMDMHEHIAFVASSDSSHLAISSTQTFSIIHHDVKYVFPPHSRLQTRSSFHQRKNTSATVRSCSSSAGCYFFSVIAERRDVELVL